MRAVFALAGIAALGWGGWLALDFALRARNAGQALLWLVGGPLVHDFLVAPVAGLTATALVRVVPDRWRGPVAVGAVSSAVLTLLAVPLLWRPFGVPVNPGLHDANYVLGLSIALAVVWAGVVGVVAGVVVGDVLRRARREGPPPR